MDARILTLQRLGVLRNNLLGDVYNPDFADTAFGIARQFQIPIIVKRRVRNFDYKQYISRRRQGVSIIL